MHNYTLTNVKPETKNVSQRHISMAYAKSVKNRKNDLGKNRKKRKRIEEIIAAQSSDDRHSNLEIFSTSIFKMFLRQMTLFP